VTDYPWWITLFTVIGVAVTAAWIAVTGLILLSEYNVWRDRRAEDLPGSPSCESAPRVESGSTTFASVRDPGAPPPKSLDASHTPEYPRSGLATRFSRADAETPLKLVP
jgi:hypothetical protein